MTLRCTRKLLKMLEAPAEPVTPRPTTVLGDWYANLYDSRPYPLVICLSERTLLAVVTHMRDSENLVPRFRDAVAKLLGRIGVSRDAIAAERQAMADIGIGPTANRRVLGCLNEAGFILAVEYWAHESYLVEEGLHLSRVMYSVNGYRRPCELALELFAASAPSSRPLLRLVH